jgi:glycosyltransferase involved in cell wall biosynthesis
MITTFFPPFSFGGDGIFVQRLSNELQKRGHEVEVVHCIDSHRLLAGNKIKQTYDIHPNIRVHGLKSPGGFLSPLATHQTGHPFFKQNRIRKILSRGFDIINYHNISLVGGPGILKYGSGIKLYTMHEHWLLCPNHTLLKFNRANCNKRMCFLCSLIYKRPPQLWRYSSLLRHSLINVDAFLALNRFAHTKHQELGSLPTKILPPFIPKPVSDFSEFDGPGGATLRDNYFLFAGRLEKLKGLQSLIPFFRQYQRAELRIAGTGRYEARLRRMAGDNSNIRFLGYQSEIELASQYRRALGLIVPSICIEMVPQVVLEAFREGTPVIVRNLGGLPELVEASKGGLTYNSEDQLRESLDRLVLDSELRERLGRQGYQTIRHEWTVEAHLNSYFELIGELQAKRGRERTAI